MARMSVSRPTRPPIPTQMYSCLGKTQPYPSSPLKRRETKSGNHAVEPFDILCWIRNVFIRAQHVLIVTPAFSKSRPSGDLTIGAVSSEEESTAEYSPVAELRMDAGFVFINPNSTDTLIEGRTRCHRNLRKAVVELGPQRQIPRGVSLVVCPMTRDRLIVKTNPVEGTIHKVIEFRLEIRKPRERESVDPTGACLVSRKDRFVDDGDRMPLLCERCRCSGTARSCSNDQNINSGAHHSYQRLSRFP